MAVYRADLPRIADAVRSIGLVHRHVAGMDMLVDAEAPKAGARVHLFSPEKRSGQPICGRFRVCPIQA